MPDTNASIEQELSDSKPSHHFMDHREKKLSEPGLLARYLAHEIRNPLNAMNMLTAVIENSIVRGGTDDMARARKQLDALRGEIGRLDKLVETFLMHGHLVAGQPERIDLPAFLQERVDFIRNEGLTHGVEVTLEMDDGEGALFICMSPSQLEQALLNVVKNAFRAMAPEGGRLTIELKRTEGDQATILVADTGVGISPEDLPNIFMPFVSCRPDGNGLGLTITKQIVESVGGRIQADSQVGDGTRFTIHLPLVASSPGPVI